MTKLEDIDVTRSISYQSKEYESRETWTSSSAPFYNLELEKLWVHTLGPFGISTLVQVHAHDVMLLHHSIEYAFHCPCAKSTCISKKILQTKLKSLSLLKIRNSVLPCVPTGSFTRPRRPHFVHTSTGCTQEIHCFIPKLWALTLIISNTSI